MIQVRIFSVLLMLPLILIVVDSSSYSEIGKLAYPALVYTGRALLGSGRLGSIISGESNPTSSKINLSPPDDNLPDYTSKVLENGDSSDDEDLHVFTNPIEDKSQSSGPILKPLPMVTPKLLAPPRQPMTPANITKILKAMYPFLPTIYN